MMFRLFYISISLFVVLLSQPALSQDKMVCNLEGPVYKQSAISPLQDLSATDILRVYLDNIRPLVNLSNRKVVIKYVSNDSVIASAMDYLNGYSMEAVIAINQKYLERRVKGEFRAPMYHWVIGHEIAHHRDGDLYYLNEKDVFANYRKELLCDETAGYIVAKLNPSFSASQLDSLLHLLLNDPNSLPSSHPPLQYRILASRAGWLRGRGEHLQVNTSASHITKDSIDNYGIRIIITNGLRHLMHITGENGNLYHFAEAFNDHDHETAILIYNYNDSGRIYLGPLVKSERNGNAIFLTQAYIYIGSYVNDEKSGHGKMIFTTGDIYNGNFSNGLRSGFGVLYYQNGDVYCGEWANDEMSGSGVLYNNKRVIASGCWKKNKYTGKECLE
jgi:hypothetical protein